VCAADKLPKNKYTSHGRIDEKNTGEIRGKIIMTNEKTDEKADNEETVELDGETLDKADKALGKYAKLYIIIGIISIITGAVFTVLSVIKGEIWYEYIDEGSQILCGVICIVVGKKYKWLRKKIKNEREKIT
jgi:hypothetical protein